MTPRSCDMATVLLIHTPSRGGGSIWNRSWHRLPSAPSLGGASCLYFARNPPYDQMDFAPFPNGKRKAASWRRRQTHVEDVDYYLLVATEDERPIGRFDKAAVFGERFGRHARHAVKLMQG